LRALSRTEVRVVLNQLFIIANSSLLLLLILSRNYLSTDGIHKHHPKSHNSFNNFINSFETINNTKVIAQIGGTAILPCIVEVSSPATVNWIRRKDFQLLTGI
jgi:hypothetical protein